MKKLVLFLLLGLLFSCGTEMKRQIAITENTWVDSTEIVIWKLTETNVIGVSIVEIRDCQYVETDGCYSHLGDCPNPIHQNTPFNFEEK